MANNYNMTTIANNRMSNTTIVEEEFSQSEDGSFDLRPLDPVMKNDEYGNIGASYMRGASILDFRTSTINHSLPK